MKNFFSACAVILAASLLSSAATVTVTLGTNNNGTPVLNGVAQNLLTARSNWLGLIDPSLTSSQVETFESFTAGTHHTSLNTAVGVFTAGGQGSMGNGTKKVEFSIHDKDSSPFQGRFNYSGNGKNWLDSNDITSVMLDFTGLQPVNYLSFFLTDVNDQGGRLRLHLNNGELMEYGFGAPAGGYRSGMSYLVTYAGDGLSSIELRNNSRNDGYGIDNVFVGSNQPSDEVPEPATYALLGGGLLAIGFWKRRRA